MAEILALFAYSMVYAILPGLVIVLMVYSIHQCFEDERLQDAQDIREFDNLAASRRSLSTAQPAQPGRPAIVYLYSPKARAAKLLQHDLQARMSSKTTPFKKGEQSI